MRRQIDSIALPGDTKVQKPMYFLLSQLTRIDQACVEEKKARADFVRTGIDLYLDLRDGKQRNISDEEILDIVKKHMYQD